MEENRFEEEHVEKHMHPVHCVINMSAVWLLGVLSSVGIRALITFLDKKGNWHPL